MFIAQRTQSIARFDDLYNLVVEYSVLFDYFMANDSCRHLKVAVTRTSDTKKKKKKKLAFLTKIDLATAEQRARKLKSNLFIVFIQNVV